MKLESIRIDRFRSIDTAELSQCGPFNVLIGKNNSGKSNLLSAIQFFFACIQGGSVVNSHPPTGRDIDFFQKDRKSDLALEASFTLELAERDALLRDIVAEAPQMKNAADGIDPSLRLTVTVHVSTTVPHFSYVKRLVLTPVSAGQSATSRTLLQMDAEAANEIHQINVKTKQEKDANKQLRALHQFLQSDRHREMLPRSLRDEGGSIPLHYFMQTVDEFGQEGFNRLAALVGSGGSLKAIKNGVDELISQSQEILASLEPGPLKHRMGTFAGDQSTIPNYVTAILQKVAQLKVLHLPERRKPIGRREAEQLLNLKVERGGPQILRSIQESVMSLLGVQIDAFKSSHSGRGPDDAPAEMDIDNFLAEANGSGIREALRVILDVEFGRPAILLVEEPEIHLHPALETSLMRFLKRISNQCQVFITTHSTNFLDTAEMKNVYLVAKALSTKVQKLSVGEAESKIPQELGIRLSSLFMYDRLVFVEGPSDEAIIREWASTLSINLSQANVGFIAMGSVRNFAHFAAETTLSFLTKRQVRVWFLIDRDEKDDADIAYLREKLGANAVLEVLDKREMENYMLVPRAISEFIELKRELAGAKAMATTPNDTDVAKAVNELADELKPFAIEKKVDKLICRPVFPTPRREFGKSELSKLADQFKIELDKMMDKVKSMQDRLPEVMKQQTDVVESGWSTGKLDLVPGDILLDRVCQQYSVRFNKERDAARLASLMKDDEIDHGIKKIIRDIGRIES